MTSIAVTLSVDSRGPCALYIMTDSRITWGEYADRWDNGQKTFCSSRFPDLFGYFGDAFFPPMMLGQIITQLDAGLLCRDNASATERHDAVIGAIRKALSQLTGSPPMLDFWILHGARDGYEMKSEFRLWRCEYDIKSRSLTDRSETIDPARSYIAYAGGSGATAILDEHKKWGTTSAAGTSRASAWAFFDALRSHANNFSGGAPQIVGLFRKFNGQHFGIYWKDCARFAGLRVSGILENNIRWFDQEFEPCDASGKRKNPQRVHKKPG